MNHLIVLPNEVNGNEISISDSKRLEHISQVLKAKIGDVIKLCVVDEGNFFGEITYLTPDGITLVKGAELHSQSSHIRLIVGLSRPQTMKKVIEHATGLGVSEFIFFKTETSEKSYAQSKIYEEESLDQLLYDGLSQSALYFKKPKVEILSHAPLKRDFGKQKYILSLETEETFYDATIVGEEITLAIGSERGWTAKEEQNFFSAGYKPIKIHDSVLRVEQAVFVSLGQLALFI